MALTRMQWRCIVTFCLPLILLLAFFALHYSLVFIHLVVDENPKDLSKISLGLTGMEVLWGYFPILSGYIFLASKGRRETDELFAQITLVRLVPREIRFYFLILPALACLILLTSGKLYIRFSAPESFIFWGLGLLLELNWVYLQGMSILCWIKDSWKMESDKAKETGLFFSPRQERCILGFIVPFVILCFFVGLYRALEYGRGPDGLIVLGFLIDLLFILGPIMGTYSWITDNWDREKMEGERFLR